MQIRKSVPVLANLAIAASAYAVTIEPVSNPDGIDEAPAIESIVKGVGTFEVDEAGDALLSPNAVGTHLSNAEFNSLVALETNVVGPEVVFATKVLPSTSIGIFGLALLTIGIGLIVIGTFSLSLGRKLEGITAREFVQQLRHLSVVSAKQNVSRNWGKKRDATWFVVMGLGSIAAGSVDWFFL